MHILHTVLNYTFPYKENLSFNHSFLGWQSFPFMVFIINISVVLL